MADPVNRSEKRKTTPGLTKAENKRLTAGSLVKGRTLDIRIASDVHHDVFKLKMDKEKIDAKNKSA